MASFSTGDWFTGAATIAYSYTDTAGAHDGLPTGLTPDPAPPVSGGTLGVANNPAKTTLAIKAQSTAALGDMPTITVTGTIGGGAFGTASLANASDGGATVMYRYKAAWDTLHHNWTGSNPDGMGHNGTHTLSAVDSSGLPVEVQFAAKKADGTYDTPVGRGPSDIGADVENLSIVSVSPDEYFIVKPHPTSDVKFTVKTNCYDETASRTYTLTIRRTESSNTVLRTISKTSASNSEDLVWDYKGDDGNLLSRVSGYYTFDLSVQRGADIAQTYRSGNLTVHGPAPNFEADDLGDFIFNDQGQAHLLLAYSLSAPPLQDSGKIDILNSFNTKEFPVACHGPARL
ncbi:MAG TPA: hypothetical protein VGK19_19995 [Capsulimonadaceae bacterium]